MKKLILAVCFVIGATAMSFAQGGGGGGRPQPAPADQAKTYQTALKLTDDQTAKITTILVAQQAKRDSLTKAGVAQADMRTAFAPIRTATTAKIKALLTPEQATAFDAMPQGGRGGRGGGGTPPPPPAK